MKKPVLFFLVAVMALLGGIVRAADDGKAPDVKPSAPERYTVKKGDTLWDIANRFLSDPWRWPEIWQSNQQIRNPHLIYPGDNLVLCRIEDRSVIAIDDGGGCAEVATRLTNKARVSSDGSTAKLNPKIHAEPLEAAIPAIPLQAIRAYLTDSRVVTDEELQKAPYVIAGNGNRIIAGAGESVYVRGTGMSTADTFGVFRRGSPYVDPETGELLGFEAEDIGSGTIDNVSNDIATLRLTRTTQEVRIEDRLLINEARNVTPVFYPRDPKGVKPGRVVRVMGSIGSGGLNSVVVLNRGERDGVQEGHTFALYQRGAVIRDRVKDEMVRLPSERAGLAMVFRTFKKVSYALIVKASTTIKAGDDIRPPVSGD